MSDPFGGAWRVREYVFDASGAPLGVVHQTRRLAAGNGSLRVAMDCDPDAGAAMARFRGRHEFDLVVDGRLRHYRGPSVLGTGVAVDDGVVLGRGVWPVFGHSFTSYSVLVTPDRQLTGGTFHRGGEVVARIVGVAGPEQGERWPALTGPSWPGEVASAWVGARRSFGASGDLRETAASERVYRADGIEDLSARESVRLTKEAGALRVEGSIDGAPLVGFGKTYGWMTAIEAVCGDAVVEWTELLDPEHGHLVGIRRWLVADRLERIDLWRLAPEKGARR
jgi:hypothetical protein